MSQCRGWECAVSTLAVKAAAKVGHMKNSVPPSKKANARAIAPLNEKRVEWATHGTRGYAGKTARRAGLMPAVMR
jgi:hypothetical protein